MPRPLDLHQIYVSVTPEENTGLAVYNHNLEEEISLDLVLLDDEGNELATAMMNLDPGQQLARFADEAELFQAYFNANPGTTRGTLQITVRNQKTACVMGIIQKRGTGATKSVTAD